jgi:hypothetical protein
VSRERIRGGGAVDSRFVDGDISRHGSDLVERMTSVGFLVQN